MEVIKKLTEIQTELKVPKGNFNSFGKYKYRSAEDILEAIKPILLMYKCTLMITDEVVYIGNKLFLCATAIFSDNEKEVSVKGYAEISEHKGMSAEQCTGTASSYARKYALNGLFLIDETESDADSKNPQDEQLRSENAALKKEIDELKKAYEFLKKPKTPLDSERIGRVKKTVQENGIKAWEDNKHLYSYTQEQENEIYSAMGNSYVSDFAKILLNNV